MDIPFLEGDIYKSVDEIFLHCKDTSQIISCVRRLNKKLRRYGRNLYVDEITTQEDGTIVASLIVGRP